MKRVLLSFLFFHCACSYLVARTPTWAQDIAPIFYAKCTPCHHPGGLAHFSLLTYSDAYSHSHHIGTQVTNRTMPPWPPDPNYRHFVQERVLTQDEIDEINQWLLVGSPQGDITQAPSQPVYNNASQLGTPDISIQMPTYTVSGTGDQHRNFPIPSNLTQDVYVTAVEVIPGNPEIVHHVIVYQDTTNTPWALDSADAGPGFETVGLNSTAKMIMAYTPGNRPYYPPVGTGVRLFKNTTLVIQIHYPDGCQGMVDSTKVNIILSSVPQREITMWVLPGQKNLVNGPINIPANQYGWYHERDTIENNLTLLAVMPHMHLLGRTIKNWAFNPVTNDTTKLVSIDNWRFHWQGNYFFTNTVKLPVGTILEAEATYDNTANNPYNPHSPPQTVVEGPGTADEMMCIVASYMPYKPGDEYLITDRRVHVEGATTICPWQSVGLKAVEGDNYLYQWFRDGIAMSNDTASTIDVSTGGNYHVQISLGPNTVNSDTVLITAGSSPTAEITVTGSTVLCPDDTVKLSAIAGFNYAYQWVRDNIPIGGQTSHSITTNITGNYSVQVYSGCYAVSDTVSITRDVCLGIEDANDQSFTVFPNPSNGTFEISSNGLQVNAMTIYDVQGSKVYVDKNLNDKRISITLSSIPSGCYFLQLQSSAGRVYKKLIVE